MSCTTPTCCTHNCRQGRDCPQRSRKPAPLWLTPLILVCMVVLLAVVGPAIDDHSGEGAQADALQAAQMRERYLLAAQKQCGVNAAVVELPDGSMRCALHTGRKTSRVAMVAP